MSVLSEIVDLLEQCGRADKAAWLRERLAVFEARDAVADAWEHAANELHSVVLGMGGLMDLSLMPEHGSTYSVESARARLDELADSLYDLTR